MAIIGRLDKQVDALLITPLDKKRTPEHAAPDEQATGEKPARAAQGTPPREGQNEKKADEQEESNASSQNERDSLQNERDTRAQLPVWLL